MKNIITGTLFSALLFLTFSTATAAPTPEETIKAYINALMKADLETAYEMVSDIDRPRFSPQQHREEFCEKFNDEACFLLLKKTTYKIKEIINKDNLTAVVIMEKTFPKYTDVLKTLLDDDFKLLKELYKERNNKENSDKIREELKEKMINGLKNDSFPPYTKKIVFKLLNEKGDWRIYFEKSVPEFIIEARILAEKKGKEKTGLFMETIRNADYEKAFSMLRPIDQKKYSINDLLKKLDIERDKTDWKETKITLTECFGLRNNSRKWSFIYDIVFTKNKRNPFKKLKIDTLLTRDGETVIFFDSLKYEK